MTVQRLWEDQAVKQRTDPAFICRGQEKVTNTLVVNGCLSGYPQRDTLRPITHGNQGNITNTPRANNFYTSKSYVVALG